jgi:DNA polymerase elongation subunit (family B)
MNYKRKSNEQIGATQASEDRRTVVLDIETVALDPSDEKGALDAMTGRVVCISMLVDDGKGAQEITFAGEDEARIITGFWDALRPGDVVVGHNVLDFDIRFLQQRSWILGIQPSRPLDTRRYYTADVIDTLQLWTSWSGNKKGVTLDALGAALGCGRKTGEGKNVAQWWVERDIDSIKKYCREDLQLTYRVFCRLTYQEPRRLALDEEQLSTTSVMEPTVEKVAEVRLS